ncbi:MAG: putative oxidoreductase [Actinomycetia bacterium]|nr:putative oxidoreductase [Actinomycetes bacterium]
MVRNFTDQPVPEDGLARVLEAGVRGPSAGHAQGLDLVVLTGIDVARYWAVTLADPSGFRWQGLLRAPVLVVPVVDPSAYAERYAEPDKAATGLGSVEAWPVPYWWVDGGAGVENLLLAAVAEGLGACFFGQFEHEAAVKDAFGIPADRRCLGTIALGHPAPDEPGRSSTRPRRTDAIHRGGW